MFVAAAPAIRDRGAKSLKRAMPGDAIFQRTPSQSDFAGDGNRESCQHARGNTPRTNSPYSDARAIAPPNPPYARAAQPLSPRSSIPTCRGCSGRARLVAGRILWPFTRIGPAVLRLNRPRRPGRRPSVEAAEVRTPVAVVEPSVALGLLAKIQGLTLRYRVGEALAWTDAFAALR